jgi:hypothetical protein
MTKPSKTKSRTIYFLSYYILFIMELSGCQSTPDMLITRTSTMLPTNSVEFAPIQTATATPIVIPALLHAGPVDPLFSTQFHMPFVSLSPQEYILIEVENNTAPSNKIFDYVSMDEKLTGHFFHL